MNLKVPLCLKYFSFFQFYCDLHHTLLQKNYSPNQKFFILTSVQKCSFCNLQSSLLVLIPPPPSSCCHILVERQVKRKHSSWEPRKHSIILCRVICYVYVTNKKQTQTYTTIRKLHFALFLKTWSAFLKESQLKPELIDSLSTGTFHAMIDIETCLKTVRWGG